MRMKRPFVVWITLTVLLQWSRAQEDNIQELSLNVNGTEEKHMEQLPVTIENETPSIPEEHQISTEMSLTDQEMVSTVVSTKKDEEEPPAVEQEISQPSTTAVITDANQKQDLSTAEATAADYQDDAPLELQTTVAATPNTKPPILPPVRPNLQPMCFSCISPLSGSCMKYSTKKIPCAPSINKQNGCYTLVKYDTKLAMRGCISELSDESHQFCVNNVNQCQLCAGMFCNVKEFPAGGAAQVLASLLVGSICFVIWLGLM